MNARRFLLITAILFTLTTISCKKKKADQHVPPDVEFKTGGTYTNVDRTVNKSDTIVVGITATKTEDDLKSYNVSYRFDGSTTSTTFFNYLLSDAEKSSYSRDVTFVTRNQAGSETWVFSIVDRDGNITQKTIVLTVK